MVQWSGEDSTSGLAAYDVQVRVDGGAWQDWRVGVTETSGVYVGILGHTYAFRSRGRDRVGTVEAWPAVPDAETRLTARVRKTYIFGGMPVAVRLLAQGETAGLLVYLHLDHLGSPVVATGAGGSVVAEVRYYPYGGMRVQIGEMPTTLSFTGQRLDAGVGLLYYRARYYDPVLGRFVQPDTVVPEPGDPQGLNWYAYVRNNPLRFTDPTGHCIPGVNCPVPDVPLVVERSIWYVSPTQGAPYRCGYGYGDWSRFAQDWHWAEDIRNLHGSRSDPTSYGGQGREAFAIEDGTITAITRGGGAPFGNNPDDYTIYVYLCKFRRWCRCRV